MKARDLKGEKTTIVSVIGDGSLTGGMAYEALNNAAKLETNFIVVLNDNNMSISENVGGVSKYLNNIRTGDRLSGSERGHIQRSQEKTRWQRYCQQYPPGQEQLQTAGDPRDVF